MSAVLRDHLARGSAIRQLAAAYDRLAEREQILWREGKVVEAEGAHVIALRILRAYQVEMDDPKPKGLA